MRIGDKYHNLNNYVLRTPLMAVNFFIDFTNDKVISDIKFKNTLKNPVIKEAIFLASPTLYFEVEKWLNNELKDKKKIDKLKISALKYIARLSSRCTPFGLFAGCSVGEFEKKTSIKLDNLKSYNRSTRLDMSYLVSLANNLLKNVNIRNNLKYYPNTSIYNIGKEIRYIEFEFDGILRKHQISAIENNRYIKKILSLSKNGINFNDLVKSLLDKNNGIDTVNDYISDLIENQIIISEIDPSVSGPDYLNHLINILSKINGAQNEHRILVKVQKLLNKVDSKIGNPVSIYLKISEILKKLNTEFDIKYLFQTDYFFKTINNSLTEKHLVSIKEALSYQNKITPYIENVNLKKFKEEYNNRYNDRTMPLAKVLDVEVGIGYKNKFSYDINPLIDDINVRNYKNINSKDYVINDFQIYLQKEIIEAISQNKYSLNLDKVETENFSENWDNLPESFSTWFEVIKINGEEKILLGASGASSAANVLARFSYGNESIYNLVKQIIEKESEVTNKTFAEIVHLPESRVGNVIMRPNFREFEIPYLSNSLISSQKKLLVNNIYINIESDQIFLSSDKTNSFIEPRLTNAHNYNISNSLPLYNFLCDLQFQKKRPSIGFYQFPLSENFSFIPRLEYKDVILSEAQWNFTKNDIKNLIKNYEDDELLYNEVIKFMHKFKLPQFVLLVENDNELLINLHNLTSLKMLLQSIKNIEIIKIKEFLYFDSGIITDCKEKKYYTNQFILSFIKK